MRFSNRKRRVAVREDYEREVVAELRQYALSDANECIDIYIRRTEG